MAAAQQLTKRKLLTFFRTARDLAAACEVSESYVSKWNMDEPIPELHELRLRHVLMPQIDWDRIAGAGKRAAA